MTYVHLDEWFSKLNAGDFKFTGLELLEATDEDQIKTLTENKPRYMARKLTEMLNM